MMFCHVCSAFIFTLLSFYISFFPVASSKGPDVSSDPFGLLQNSDMDSFGDDNLFDMDSNPTTLVISTSDDALTIDLPVDSNNLFGEYDLFSQELIQSSTDECSFDAASTDIEDFLHPIEKRESGQVCKTRQQGSSSGKPPEPPEDPQMFLNNLPLFEPYEDPNLHERLEICKPLLVRDRNIPMCLFGVSELALAAGLWFPDDNLVGCAPCMSFTSRCNCNAYDLRSGSLGFRLSG